jgi:hypothetical protein
MQNIVQADYQLYRRWFERSLDVIWRMPSDLPPEADPMAGVANAEAASAATGVKSVAAGITDTISMTDRYSKADIESADAQFKREGLPTLTAMRALFSKRTRAILKSGKVTNEEDYYALKAVEDAELADSTRAEIERLLAEYESGLSS